MTRTASATNLTDHPGGSRPRLTGCHNKRQDTGLLFATPASLHGEMAGAPAVVSLKDVRADKLTYFLTSTDDESNDICAPSRHLGDDNDLVALLAYFGESGNLQPQQPSIGKAYLSEAAARVARKGGKQG